MGIVCASLHTMGKGTKQWFLEFSLEIRKNLFPRRGVRHWKNCPGTPILGDVQSSSLSRSLGLNAIQKCYPSKTTLILLDRDFKSVLSFFLSLQLLGQLILDTNCWASFPIYSDIAQPL